MIRLFTASARRIHPDQPHLGERTYALNFTADNQELAEEICRIHGLQYDGEVYAILEDTPDGFMHIFDKDNPELDPDKFGK